MQDRQIGELLLNLTTALVICRGTFFQISQIDVAFQFFLTFFQPLGKLKHHHLH